jgi:AcrR family transcriptional regulator
MPRDADATRARLLLAARDEFAAAGIAGARIDRISAAAASNKAQIYHYFGSKEGLFDAVFDQMVAETLDEVPIDPDDLPEYAGRLHDSYQRRPWVQRLATWNRLERGSGGTDAASSALIEAVMRSNAAKIAAIEHAQRAGRLPRTYSAKVLLGLVVHTAALWSSSQPEYDTVVAQVSPARRRATVVSAVAAILAG